MFLVSGETEKPEDKSQHEVFVEPMAEFESFKIKSKSILMGRNDRARFRQEMAISSPSFKTYNEEKPMLDIALAEDAEEIGVLVASSLEQNRVDLMLYFFDSEDAKPKYCLLGRCQLSLQDLLLLKQAGEQIAPRLRGDNWDEGWYALSAKTDNFGHKATHLGKVKLWSKLEDLPTEFVNNEIKNMKKINDLPPDFDLDELASEPPMGPLSPE